MRSYCLLLYFISIPLAFAQAQNPAKDLKLEMRADKTGPFLPGEHFYVKLKLTNTSKDQTHPIVKPGDGSMVGWREPHIFFTAEHLVPDGRWLPADKASSARCGNFDSEWQKDIVHLAPGQSEDLKGIDSPIYGLNFSNATTARIQAHYHYNQGKTSRDGEIIPESERGAMKDSPSFKISSSPLEVTFVHPLSLSLALKAAPKRNGREERLSDLIELKLTNDTKHPLTFVQPRKFGQSSVRIQMKSEHGGGTSPWISISNEGEPTTETLSTSQSRKVLGASPHGMGLDGYVILPKTGKVQFRAHCTITLDERRTSHTSDWITLE